MRPGLLILVFFSFSAGAVTPLPGREINDPELNAYFREETARIARDCLTSVRSAEEWRSALPQRRRQLREMLGIEPLPVRGDLKPVITGRVDQPAFVLEKLHFQSLPGLYVTANLYIPKARPRPAPAILYVCGHGPVITNGISYGNKVSYQHHGAWFAQHGYVCLIIDTVQLGEIQGLHHGTYRERMWWWNSRGYTPAGVETWNGIRALDYLSSRPEVDTNRFGITGRSGGGAYSWFITAVDERIKAAAPVAGITDLENHVVDGCVEGHCDCMYFVNTYRWDYAMLAALAAPRPLLFCNTDSDTIFPLDGVMRVHTKLRGIYQLLGADASLGLVITPGPHKDTQDLQMPVLRWFDKYLKGEQPMIEDAALKLLAPEQLRVFKSLPRDAINTNIADTFVPKRDASTEARRDELAKWSFAGWPKDPPPARVSDLRPTSVAVTGSAAQWYAMQSQPHARLLLALNASPAHPRGFVLRIADGNGDSLGNPRETNCIVATLYVRGIGPNAWPGDDKKQAQIRRRFMLLGQTVDSMRVWDIRRAIQTIRTRAQWRALPLLVEADGAMAVNAQHALLFESGVEGLFTNAPTDDAERPDYLNAMRAF